jgi:cytochrome c
MRTRQPPPRRWVVATSVVTVMVLASALGVGGPPPTDPPGVDPARDAQATPQRELEGWFTLAQAERGRDAYMEHCAECHSPDLRARSAYISLYAYPALRGAYFWDRWGGQTVHTLQLVIEHSMPLHAPRSLSGEVYAAITAFILSENGFPPGPRELPGAADGADRLVTLPIEPIYAAPRARAQLVGAPRAAAERPIEPPEAPPASPVDPPVDPADDPGEEAAEAFGAPDEVRDVGEPEEGEEGGEPAEADEARGPDPDTRDGWFTEAQVESGRVLYVSHCTRCHGGAMQGIGVAPSLAGDNFMERWEGESVADLFYVVHALMPLDDQGALHPAASAALVAYVLQQNGFAPGPFELPQSEARLEPFVIESPEE